MTKPRFQLSYRFASGLISRILTLVVRRRWRGLENFPASGNCIIATNHVTEFDSLTMMDFVNRGAKIPVRSMVKAELFNTPVVKFFITRAKQIPAYRGSTRPGETLRLARETLQSGETVLVFPEGTLSRDPQKWPMKAKTGVGALALATRVPVIPVAQWGAHNILDTYARKPKLFPRQTVWVQAGEPVDLTDLYDRADDPAAVQEATDRVMAAIVEMLSGLRQETPPEKVWDMAVDGDPYNRKKKPKPEASS